MRDLSVDFTGLKFNLQKISESRVLSQFFDKKIFKLLLGAFSSEIQELLDAIVDLMEYRTLQKAQGKQLDVIGRIVGIGREFYDYEESYWFASDKDEVQPDNGHWWSNPAEQAVISVMDDITFRKRIWLKILENHNLFSANPELKEQILEGLGENIGIQSEGMVTGKIYTEPTISLTNYNILDYNKDTQQVDNDYLFAYPAVTTISEVVRRN